MVMTSVTTFSAPRRRGPVHAAFGARVDHRLRCGGVGRHAHYLDGPLPGREYAGSERGGYVRLAQRTRRRFRRGAAVPRLRPRQSAPRLLERRSG